MFRFQQKKSKDIKRNKQLWLIQSNRDAGREPALEEQALGWLDTGFGNAAPVAVERRGQPAVSMCGARGPVSGRVPTPMGSRGQQCGLVGKVPLPRSAWPCVLCAPRNAFAKPGSPFPRDRSVA